MSRPHRKTVSPPAKQKPREPSHREFIAAWFSFHRYCKSLNCRRARHCEGGENPACVKAFWPQVPDDLKMQLRVMVEQRSAGASVRDAMIAGEAAAARVRLNDVAQDCKEG